VSMTQLEFELAHGRVVLAGIDLAAIDRSLDARAAVGEPIAGALDLRLEYRAERVRRELLQQRFESRPLCGGKIGEGPSNLLFPFGAIGQHARFAVALDGLRVLLADPPDAQGNSALAQFQVRRVEIDGNELAGLSSILPR